MLPLDGTPGLKRASVSSISIRSGIPSPFEESRRLGITPYGKCSTAAALASTAFYSPSKGIWSLCITSAAVHVAPSSREPSEPTVLFVAALYSARSAQTANPEKPVFRMQNLMRRERTERPCVVNYQCEGPALREQRERPPLGGTWRSQCGAVVTFERIRQLRSPAKEPSPRAPFLLCERQVDPTVPRPGLGRESATAYGLRPSG
jgi:hypothetical protein